MKNHRVSQILRQRSAKEVPTISLAIEHISYQFRGSIELKRLNTVILLLVGVSVVSETLRIDVPEL